MFNLFNCYNLNIFCLIPWTDFLSYHLNRLKLFLFNILNRLSVALHTFWHVWKSRSDSWLTLSTLCPSVTSTTEDTLELYIVLCCGKLSNTVYVTKLPVTSECHFYFYIQILHIHIILLIWWKTWASIISKLRWAVASSAAVTVMYRSAFLCFHFPKITGYSISKASKLNKNHSALEL